MKRKISRILKTVVFLLLILVLWNVVDTLRFSNSAPNDELLTISLNSTLDYVQPTDVNKHAHLDDYSVTHMSLEPNLVHIAVVVCGERYNETIVMIKSAMIFSTNFIKFTIMCDSETSILMKSVINTWPQFFTSRLELQFHPISFPPEHAEEWRKLFKPCASQRLFLPSLLEKVDSVLYMDTDTLFLTSPSYIWEHFKKMNEYQIAAVAPEHEDHSAGWYNRFARHPYYGSLGINSGVMLMNLTRMRTFGWEKYVVPIYHEYKSKITWGDQDIINIVFHFHPEKLYVYPCNYNFRPDHCMYMSVCKHAEENGIIVLHGNRGTFHTEKQPSFKAVYSALDAFVLGEDLSNLLNNVKSNLLQTSFTNCGKILDPFTKAAELQIKRISENNISKRKV